MCQGQLAWCLAHRKWSVSTSYIFVIIGDEDGAGGEDGSFAIDPGKEGLGFQITWNTVAKGQLFSTSSSRQGGR